MKIFTLLISFLLIIPTAMAQQWSELDTPDDEDLLCVFFTSEDKGFVGTKDPVVWTTEDGGDSWSGESPGALESFGTEWIQDIYFIDDDTGWLAAYSGGATNFPGGALLKTTNGGETWTSPIDDDSTFINAIHFIDASYGWAVGQDGLIMHSTDGGDNWEIQQSAEEAYHLNDVYFTDMNNGWAVGGEDNFGATQEGYIYRTTDGGVNWELQYTADIQFVNNRIEALTYNGDQVFWGDGVYSNDGGETWDTDASLFGRGVSFANADDGWFAESEQILVTDDAGANWTTATDNVGLSTFTIFSDLYAVDSEVVYVVGSNGVVLKRTMDASGIADVENLTSFAVYPNPFSENLSVDYALQTEADVRLDVVDAAGKTVSQLVDETQPSGEYRYRMHRADFGEADGPYVIRLVIDGQVLSEPVVPVN